MKSVEVVSEEERTAWRQRAQELRLHTKDRPKYYPFNIDEWEEKGKEIVYKYNIQLQEMNKNRKESEKEYNAQVKKEKEEKKERLKKEREEKLRLNEERRIKRRRTTEENTNMEPRR